MRAINMSKASRGSNLGHEIMSASRFLLKSYETELYFKIQ